jgi:hypothetical protein
LDIFATVHEKTARRSASIAFHTCYGEINSESVQAKSSRLATPAELKNPSNAKELHGKPVQSRALLLKGFLASWQIANLGA